MIDQKLLDILACPACKSDVTLSGSEIVCTNKNCALRYPIRDGIPVMLIEEAKKS